MFVKHADLCSWKTSVGKTAQSYNLALLDPDWVHGGLHGGFVNFLVLNKF